MPGMDARLPVRSCCGATLNRRRMAYTLRVKVQIAHRSEFGSGMARLTSQLQQGRRGTSACFGAFAAAQSAGEVVHEGGRRMFHRREIDVARRLAPCALDLQPGKPAVDSLIDRR